MTIAGRGKDQNPRPGWTEVTGEDGTVTEAGGTTEGARWCRTREQHQHRYLDVIREIPTTSSSQE